MAADERTMLVAYLDAQRNHVLGILEGLSEEDLRRPVLPSGWTCLELVQHLALDVEQFWFQAVIAGEQDAIDSLEEGADAWRRVAPDVPAGEIFDLYRQEAERANAIIGATPLDAAPAWWPGDLFGDWRLQNLRQTILHVITETACHAGHLDAVRELIDGRRWMDLTE
jgi:uncharacterized damage-inducible protein DinB